jgi:anthranilate synthase/aminodeoxychorismate synthase-like glutamine amidotransferase
MILLIDNYDSFTYNLYQMLFEFDQDIRIVRNDKITLAEISVLNPSAIILSPGPGRPEDAGICVELVKTLSGTCPIMGVCLGHQAIVHAFGGNIGSAGELFHGKTSMLTHEGTGIFEGLDTPFQAGRYHSLMAERHSLPEVFQVDAVSEHGLIMAIHHKNHPTVGVQFHPESILTPQGHMLVKNFLTQARMK